MVSSNWLLQTLHAELLHPGDILPGRRLDVHQAVCFDGNTIHATMPFQGDRVMMVFFCVKRNIPVSPSSSFLPFARFLGFSRSCVFLAAFLSCCCRSPSASAFPGLAFCSCPVVLLPVLSLFLFLRPRLSCLPLPLLCRPGLSPLVGLLSLFLRLSSVLVLLRLFPLLVPFLLRSLFRLLHHRIACYQSPNVWILPLITISEWLINKRE